jgi:energy-coupling factor transporter transmembrane protein EcfT
VIHKLESLLRQARIGESRSSVINPLQWTLVVIIFALFLFLEAKAPMWLLGTTAAASGFVLLLLVFAFVYFMFKDPDALRSEKYSLVKTAIEKKLVGDSLTGLREVMETFEGSDQKALGTGEAGTLGPKDD